MKFEGVYRLSFYLMLFFATLTMSVDAIDSKISMFFPLATAAACALAFVTVDRNPRLGLSRPMAYGLLLIAASLSVLEFRAEENLVLTLAHILVYLQLVKIFLPKLAEDDWLLFGLGVMQVVVGAVISQSDRVGMLLVTWALLSLWVLGLFSLHRESVRARSGSREFAVVGSSGARASRHRAEPYPGLFSLGFFFSALRVMSTTLALGGVIFMLLPRRATTASAKGVQNPAKHMTGFDDEVQLGQLGEILESDNVVMSIELFDAQDRRVAPPEEELLWRGVTMEEYKHGRWHRRTRHHATLPHPPRKPKSLPGFLRQQIKLESTDSDVLFGLKPMLRVTTRGRFDPELNSLDGSIFRSWTRPGAYDYEVVSVLDPELPQPGESSPVPDRVFERLSPAARMDGLRVVPEDLPEPLARDFRRLQNLLDLPSGLRPRLQKIALALIDPAKVSPNDVAGRARILEEYLRSSGQFAYSLRMNTVDPDVDPVEDFLVNRKEGHCEYFASALTLLLRSIGIPARMVNGFKGGDWNGLARVLSVRQKHAHSWVEAYLGEGPDHTARWLTLDPTPATEREQSVARVGGIARNVRQLTDLVRYIWVFYVVGFNSERQNTLLYEPIRKLAREAKDGFSIMGGVLQSALSEVVYFQNFRQFFSLRGLVVSFTGLLMLALLVRGGLWARRRFLHWYRGADEGADTLSAGVLFYRRMAQLLAEFGLDRPPAETQHEFARRATLFLAGRGSDTQPVSDVPDQVAAAFYRVRFGHSEIGLADLKHLEARLDALEASLRADRE